MFCFSAKRESFNKIPRNGTHRKRNPSTKTKVIKSKVHLKLLSDDDGYLTPEDLEGKLTEQIETILSDKAPVIGHVCIPKQLLRFADEKNVAFAFGPKFASDADRMNLVLSTFPGLSKIDERDPRSKANGVVKRVKMKGATQSGRNGLLYWVLHTREPLKLFQIEIVQIVTDYLWKFEGLNKANLRFVFHFFRAFPLAIFFVFYDKDCYGSANRFILF